MHFQLRYRTLLPVAEDFPFPFFRLVGLEILVLEPCRRNERHGQVLYGGGPDGEGWTAASLAAVSEEAASIASAGTVRNPQILRSDRALN